MRVDRVADDDLCRSLHDLMQCGENLPTISVTVVVEDPLEVEHVRIGDLLQLIAVQVTAGRSGHSLLESSRVLRIGRVVGVAEAVADKFGHCWQLEHDASQLRVLLFGKLRRG